MKVYFYLFFLTAPLAAVVCGGCSAQAIKESDADTVLNHYRMGMQKLDGNDLKTPEAEFRRALELDKKSPMGYTGMAFLELARSNYDEALKHAKKAVKKDPSFVDAHLALGYTLVTRKHGDMWFEESIKHLERAYSLDPDNERTLFYLGECYYKAEEYEKGKDFYTKTAAKAGIFAVLSNTQIAFINKVLTVEPLSKKGSVVARRDKINRAELCVLLIEELKLKELLLQKQPDFFRSFFNDDFSRKEKTIQVKSEISGNKEKKWILDVIILNIPFFEQFPDGYFYPDKLVTRLLFAQVIQGVMVMVSDDRSLATMYLGQETKFNDVNPNYYAFNAVNLCVDRGIFAVSEEGDFNPNDAVSGIDAVIALRKVEDLLTK